MLKIQRSVVCMLPSEFDCNYLRADHYYSLFHGNHLNGFMACRQHYSKSFLWVHSPPGGMQGATRVHSLKVKLCDDNVMLMVAFNTSNFNIPIVLSVPLSNTIKYH